MGLFSGQGVIPSLKGLPSNEIALPAGATFNVPGGEAGWYMIKAGLYSTFQSFDPISGIWRNIGASGFGGAAEYTYLDGTTNYRFANQTGCAVGAVVTAVGSGYTSTPTVVASAGNSIWRAIVGGAVSTTVAITNGGLNYTYPPIVVIAAPPAGGVQATATATLTAGVVTAVTITDQGAGYVSAPIVTFINDSREGVNNVSTGYNAAVTLTLTGANTVTAIVCLDHGTPLTSLPTLTISGGGGSSAAATVVAVTTITAVAVGTAGAGLAGAAARITAEDTTAITAANTNPRIGTNLVTTRSADVRATVTTGALAGTPVVLDGGIYSNFAPAPLVIPSASVATTAPVVTLTMGGATDAFLFTPV